MQFDGLIASGAAQERLNFKRDWNLLELLLLSTAS